MLCRECLGLGEMDGTASGQPLASAYGGSAQAALGVAQQGSCFALVPLAPEHQLVGVGCLVVDRIQRRGPMPLAQPVAELDEAATEPPQVAVADWQPVETVLVDAFTVGAEP